MYLDLQHRCVTLTFYSFSDIDFILLDNLKSILVVLCYFALV